MIPTDGKKYWTTSITNAQRRLQPKNDAHVMLHTIQSFSGWAPTLDKGKLSTEDICCQRKLILWCNAHVKGKAGGGGGFAVEKELKKPTISVVVVNTTIIFV